MSDFSTDPFDVLGVPARYDLSAADLRAAFLRRSAALHPDVTGDAGASEGPDEESAAALNEAKELLTNPESRAEALLRRLGGPRKEEDRSLPPAFLQEMMEVREEIEGAVEGKDADAIRKWEEWAEERRRGHMKTVGGIFAELLGRAERGAEEERGGGEGTLQARRAIRMELNMWRYVERLIEYIDRREEGGGGSGAAASSGDLKRRPRPPRPGAEGGGG
jgi:molecular chaperone HscB